MTIDHLLAAPTPANLYDLLEAYALMRAEVARLRLERVEIASVFAKYETMIRREMMLTPAEADLLRKAEEKG